MNHLKSDINNYFMKSVGNKPNLTIFGYYNNFIGLETKLFSFKEYEDNSKKYYSFLRQSGDIKQINQQKDKYHLKNIINNNNKHIITNLKNTKLMFHTNYFYSNCFSVDKYKEYPFWKNKNINFLPLNLSLVDFAKTLVYAKQNILSGKDIFSKIIQKAFHYPSENEIDLNIESLNFSLPIDFDTHKYFSEIISEEFSFGLLSRVQEFNDNIVAFIPLNIMEKGRYLFDMIQKGEYVNSNLELKEFQYNLIIPKNDLKNYFNDKYQFLLGRKE